MAFKLIESAQRRWRPQLVALVRSKMDRGQRHDWSLGRRAAGERSASYRSTLSAGMRRESPEPNPWAAMRAAGFRVMTTRCGRRACADATAYRYVGLGG